MNVELYFDGNKCNTGVSCSYKLTYNKLVKEETKMLSETTVPEAEYNGLLSGLSVLKSEYFNRINLIAYGDSKLIINQMNKCWECKAPNLRILRSKCFNISNNLKSAKFIWIPRDKNKAG